MALFREVAELAETLAKESPLVRVERLDAAIDLARARALGVNGNGAIAVSRGAQTECRRCAADEGSAGSERSDAGCADGRISEARRSRRGGI